MNWRPLGILGALLATVPAWPTFKAGELAVLLPIVLLANPYRTCVSILYLRGRGTVQVLFDMYNPREPRVIYGPRSGVQSASMPGVSAPMVVSAPCPV